MSDVCIETGNPKEVCVLGLTPSTSTTVMTVIGDVLVVMLMKRIGFNNEDYAKRHHGGYLGDKSRMQAKASPKKPHPQPFSEGEGGKKKLRLKFFEVIKQVHSFNTFLKSPLAEGI